MDCVINKVDGQTYIIDEILEADNAASLVSASTTKALNVPLSDLSEASLSSYEVERMNNILRNWRVANGSGVWAQSGELRKQTSARGQSTKTFKAKVESCAPLRRSGRKRAQTQYFSPTDVDSEDDGEDGSYEPEDLELETTDALAQDENLGHKSNQCPPSKKRARVGKAYSAKNESMQDGAVQLQSSDKMKTRPMPRWKPVKTVKVYREVILSQGRVQSQSVVDHARAEVLMSRDDTLCLACFYEDGLEVILFSVLITEPLYIGSLMSYAVNNKNSLEYWKVMNLVVSVQERTEAVKRLLVDSRTPDWHDARLGDRVVKGHFERVLCAFGKDTC